MRLYDFQPETQQRDIILSLTSEENGHHVDMLLAHSKVCLNKQLQS